VNTEDAITRLNETHEFPTNFIFKVIGQTNGSFESEVKEVCETHGGAKSWSARDSKGARHRALTISLHVKNAEEVIEIWTKLRACSGTHMLL
jgi:putative lipoic acid-binding regulatory protein